MSTRKHWDDYHPQAIETRWQQTWEEGGLHLAHQGGGKPKYYCLDFFPYPSGDGLHVGHCRNYVPTDVLSRYKRMRGYNVLHPMGWDAFGEPSEQFAVAHNIHPQITTEQNTASFRRQFRLFGASYDWSREILSSSPEYYRWTQWFFLLLYRRGLAYRDTNWQWWCPTCQTTLSSHEAAGGVCWRGHTGVVRREIPAWYFRITAYADKLLEGLERIDWPEPIKAIQRNWIGRSQGVQVIFRLQDQPEGKGIETFTTRPDTLYGVTFIALAPEHALVSAVTTPEQQAEMQEYLVQAARQGEIERMSETRPKTGVFSGSYALHPLTSQPVPVWIADYVLPTYGSGAVMGVPAHDGRDFAFAQSKSLPFRVVVSPPGWQGEALTEAYTGSGRLVNSGEIDGCASQDGGEQIASRLEKAQLGRRVVVYRMRDWLISRQRYWGAPIPIIHCPTCGEVPVPEDQLPVLLPAMDNFQPDGSGRSPLARLPEFVNTTCPKCGGAAQRETDTMGGFACSSWYFLRFANPHYHAGPFDPEAVRYWLPVDIYVGGAEHAVLHLLYARFWIKVMFDAGLVEFDEPFSKLLNQGQLMGLDGQRMSKSRGNVITPDSIVAEYGADALRVFVMFMAPFDEDANWSMEGINGARRFLNRLWTLFAETYVPSQAADAEDMELERLVHRTIRMATERIETLRFNTLISLLMEFTNQLAERQRQPGWCTRSFHQALETLLLLIAPVAPYIADEIWQRTGHSGSVHQAAWPSWDAELARLDLINVAIQVNGRVRQVLEVPAEMGKDEIIALAQASQRLQPFIAGYQVQRVVYVPGRVVNFVVHREANIEKNGI